MRARVFGHFLIPFDLPHFYETEVVKTGEVLEVTNKPGSYSAFVYSDRSKLEEGVLFRLQVFVETVYMQMIKGCEHNDTWH